MGKKVEGIKKERKRKQDLLCHTTVIYLRDIREWLA
jgi:hypothetical protein